MFNIQIERYITAGENQNKIYNATISTFYDNSIINSIKLKNSNNTLDKDKIYDIKDFPIDDIEFSILHGKTPTTTICVNDLCYLNHLEIIINKLKKLFNEAIKTHMDNLSFQKKYLNEDIETFKFQND